MYSLLKELFPICRSITGPGTRQTLERIQQEIPGLVLHEVPTGTACLDWIIPDEWCVHEAWVKGPDGRKIIDFCDSNLHLVNYSTGIYKHLELGELQKHLHSLPEAPNTIPYVTSYYNRDWGFCLPHSTRIALEEGTYEVYVDADHYPGSLTYGELVLPGRYEREILISTYVCHPSMANNELSGPVVTVELAKWLMAMPQRDFTYRIVFVPETIGAVAFISQRLDDLRSKVVGGYVLTCIGDDRAYSYLESPGADTISDDIAQHVLKHSVDRYDRYSFLKRGSDERQYCSPGVGLPMASLMRSKYHEYPEYHTSDDDLSLVTETGLEGGLTIARRCLEVFERECVPVMQVAGEPMLNRHGMGRRLGTRKMNTTGVSPQARLRHVMALADGTRSSLHIAERIGVPVWEIWEDIEALETAGLLIRSPVHYPSAVEHERVAKLRTYSEQPIP